MATLQPREVVLQYGLLPLQGLAPQLESLASVQAAHRSLVAAATTGSDGQKFVSCPAAAAALDISPEQCELLLDTLAAVGGRRPACAAAAGQHGGGGGGGAAPAEAAAAATTAAADVWDLSLFLVSQLYDREAHKPETQDHWPDATSMPAGAADAAAALRGGARSAQPGSPGGANNSRLLIKSQLAAQQQRQQAYARGYSEFLHRHQRALLELVADAEGTGGGAAARSQAAQGPAAAAAPPPKQQQQQPAGDGGGGDDSEMAPADQPPPAAAGAAPAAGGGGGGGGGSLDESMLASPDRQPSEDDGASSGGQQAPGAGDAAGGKPLGRSSAGPPAWISAAEFDRLGFLLEVVPDAAAAAAGGSPLPSRALQPNGSAAGSREGGGGGGGGRRPLSAHVPCFAAQGGSVTADELLAWMNGCWQQPQLLHQHQHQQGKHKGAAALLGSPVPAASHAVAAVHGSPAGPLSGPAAAGGAAVAGAGEPAGSEAPASPPRGAPATVQPGSSPPGAGANGAPASPVAQQREQPQQHSPVTPAAGGGGMGGLGSIRVATARGMVAVAAGAVDDRGVCGAYRGTVVRGPLDVSRDEFTLANCVDCHIYVLAPVKFVRVTNCTDCTVCIGAVGTLLRVDGCERLQLTAAAARVLVVSCHSCTLHLGTPRPPALLGDCRFVRLGPYNTRYESLLDHLAAAGIRPGQPSLWDQPLLLTAGAPGGCSGGGAGAGAGAAGGGGGSGGGAKHEQQQPQQRRPGSSTPSSPHAHGGGAAEQRRAAAAAAHKSVVLMPPEEFLPLVVPFRGLPGPLAGGAAHAASTQWLPGSHKQHQGPLPPFPFPLPPAFDAALQQQYRVVTDLRSRIRGSGLDEPRRNQLQAVIQGFFREWLHSSGAIRQVYDLSKLEGDEYGPVAGGSPPATLRDATPL